MAYPYGVVEDILVKVDKFIFLVDFVVLDIEEDAKVQIILGRPFLATRRALIDVQQGELMLRVANEKVTFSINEAIKHKVDKKDCFQAEIIESPVLEKMDNHVRKNPLERTLLSRMQPKELSEEVSDEEVVHCAYQLKVLKPLFSTTRRIDLNKSEGGGEETSKDVKPRLIHLILLMQEFDMEIRDKQGKQHLIIDYLSRL